MACGTGWCRRYADNCSASCTPGRPVAETCNYFDDDCDGIIDNGTDARPVRRARVELRMGKCIPENGASGTGGMDGIGKGGMVGGGITGTGGIGGPPAPAPDPAVALQVAPPSRAPWNGRGWRSSCLSVCSAFACPGPRAPRSRQIDDFQRLYRIRWNRRSFGFVNGACLDEETVVPARHAAGHADRRGGAPLFLRFVHRGRRLGGRGAGGPSPDPRP